MGSLFLVGITLSNHQEQTDLQITRESGAAAIKIKRKPDSLFGYDYEDLKLSVIKPILTLRAM